MFARIKPLVYTICVNGMTTDQSDGEFMDGFYTYRTAGVRRQVIH